MVTPKRTGGYHRTASRGNDYPVPHPHAHTQAQAKQRTAWLTQIPEVRTLAPISSPQPHADTHTHANQHTYKHDAATTPPGSSPHRRLHAGIMHGRTPDTVPDSCADSEQFSELLGANSYSTSYNAAALQSLTATSMHSPIGSELGGFLHADPNSCGQCSMLWKGTSTHAADNGAPSRGRAADLPPLLRKDALHVAVGVCYAARVPHHYCGYAVMHICLLRTHCSLTFYWPH